MDGLLCAHILKVMAQLNLQQIPTKIPEHHSGQGPSFGVPPTNKLRFNSLCRKMTNLAYDACFNEETYKIVSDAISNLSVLVDATSNPQDSAEASASG